MGYSIIFETKICKLDNGDIIHFSRQGCNNDTEGRSRNDFEAKYYTADEWEKEIEKWESIPKSETGFDLKIGSRFCQMADYGKHLRTMTKRAKNFNDFKSNRSFRGKVYDGITYYPVNGDPIDYPPNCKEETDIVYGIWYGKIEGRYSNRIHFISSEEEVINSLKKKEVVTFHVGKERK